MKDHSFKHQSHTCFIVEVSLFDDFIYHFKKLKKKSFHERERDFSLSLVFWSVYVFFFLFSILEVFFLPFCTLLAAYPPGMYPPSSVSTDSWSAGDRSVHLHACSTDLYLCACHFLLWNTPCLFIFLSLFLLLSFLYSILINNCLFIRLKQKLKISEQNHLEGRWPFISVINPNKSKGERRGKKKYPKQIEYSEKRRGSLLIRKHMWKDL